MIPTAINYLSDYNARFNNRIPDTVEAIYAPDLSDADISLFSAIASSPAFEGQRIALMPDAHPAKASFVGLVATYTDRICPAIVSGDIGCGVLLVPVKPPKKGADLGSFDKAVKSAVPMGVGKIHSVPTTSFDGTRFRCWDSLSSRDKVDRYLGTLGSGNHFIELDRDDNTGRWWLAIHSGSRNLGTMVYEHYQHRAYDACLEAGITNHDSEELPYLSAYVSGQDLDDYIHDAGTAAEFAAANRSEMARAILKASGWKEDRTRERIDCRHNYIDAKLGIVRKGAISAKAGESIVVPLNMADGIVIGIGRGEGSWLWSAPHGAGRTMGRKEARETISMGDYRRRMQDAGVWSSCVSTATVDEAPQVYKDADMIVESLGETIDITARLRTVYNAKGGK